MTVQITLTILERSINMSQDMVEIFVNNKHYAKVDRKGALGDIVNLCMPYLEFMSAYAMRDWILEACNLVEETLEWKANSNINKKIKYLREYFKKNTELDRLRMQQFTINVILSANGLGTLRGFGFGEIGSNYQRNPEVISTHNG